MIYKNFDTHITRKHGIILEGWPLPLFDNPSAIGSQVELNVLLRSWQSGATRFRKMNEHEYMSWMESRVDLVPPSTAATNAATNAATDFSPATSLLQPHNGNTSIVPPIVPPANPPMQAIHTAFNIISLESVATPPTNNSASKKTRKIRSDKGKPRKKPSQVPGANVFHAGTH
jgi:hypothetical protein